MVKSLCILCSLYLLSYLHLSGQATIEPMNLRCEYLQNPLGIASQQPRLSWQLTSGQRDRVQTGYEIIVSERESAAREGKGEVWSSGKVNSAAQNQIRYDGTPLKSFTRYYWRVKVFDNDGAASPWSAVHWFETAALHPNQWTAKWIGDGSKLPNRDEDYYKDDPMPLFRKIFPAPKALASARLYISGLGYYEAFINGAKVSDAVLDPGWTTYREEVLYAVHDITPLVRAGTNVAAVMLGNGWWNPLPFRLFGKWQLRDYQQTGRPCLKAEIHLRYKDGTQEVIVTDESWKTAPGPIVRNNVYLGEHYDARLELAGWSTSTVEKQPWRSASLADGPDGLLTPQLQPPVRVTKVIKPIAVNEQKPGVFIVDMGQNFAGVARIKVKGKRGTRITLRFGEGLFPDGSLNVMTTVATQIKKGGIKGGPGAPETAWQEDSYTLKGTGTEVWSPRFTFHGFRYVEITGWPGSPALGDVEGLRMNADLEVAGQFRCSNPMFNKLHDVIQWTFLSNVFSVQSDCPGREKMGYGADIVVTANAFLYNYNMSQFYRKTVRDYANEQRPLGGMTEIAPFTGIDDRGYGDLSGPLGWQLAFPYAQKQLYEFYGDTAVIARHYPALVRQIGFLQRQAKDDLFYWDISDHNSIDPKPESFSASAFYYHHVILAAEFAGLLGNDEDSVRYANLGQRIKRRMLNQFYVPGTGRFDNATQAAQLFGLWYDLSPDPEKSMDVLLAELARHQWHLSTGIFGTAMFFDVMRRADRNEAAYRVVNGKDYPGWGYMLARGATTLWESWDFPETVPSRNHPMFGSVDEWFYRSLLGINNAEPGFKKIRIRPQPAGDLTFARGSYESVRGEIVSGWSIDGNVFALDVAIPPNTRAEIWIPSVAGGTVTESGVPVAPARREKAYMVVETGSGRYSFRSQIR